MHHAFFALAAHVDIDRFEFEDGLVRDAGRSLLEDETTISRVLIDVPTERTLILDIDTDPPPWHASIVISAEDIAHCTPPQLAELVVDVASIHSSLPASIIEQSELSSEWIGTAVPGAKISFLLTRSAGVDPASYDSWLRDALSDCVDKIDDIGCRALTPLREDELSNEFDTLASFWFPDEQALGEAVEGLAFSGITSSHLVDTAALQTISSVEHRLTPNPNAWSMPTGPLMPVREDENDEEQ